jgi:pyruvate,water dikinase
MKKPNRSKAFILWFDELGRSDVALVGGKNASLGEMYCKLTERGVRVPYGFAVTAHAYFTFIQEAGIGDDIRRILRGLNTHDVEDLARRGQRVRQVILEAEFSEELRGAITAAYEALCQRERIQNVDTAIRSSATAEDLPDASFAGQQETYLNVRGKTAVLQACRKCFASLFTNRAISYREDHGFDHTSIGLSVAVQRMVRSDLGSAGVMFSIDTESGFEHAVLINGSYGLGEYVVKGVVNPDEFLIFKPTLLKGYHPILKRKLGSKRKKLVYSVEGTSPTEEHPVPLPERRRFCLRDVQVLQLARWAVLIEDHYGIPMDMEWALDGKTGELYIVQARPETVHARRDRDILEEYTLRRHGNVLVTGAAVGGKIGVGKARVIKDVREIAKFRPGDVLVTDSTDPDWEPIMKIAAAIVTDAGGRTSHAAIVSRELGIPAVVGCSTATRVIHTGQEVTVSCAEGEIGRVYEGALPFAVRRTNLHGLPRPRTKIMMNVGTPESAFHLSRIPNDGVGLAREEFIITESVGVHPLALLEVRKQRRELQEKIARLAAGYRSPRDYFVSKLAEGISMIAAAFYPRDVILRFSDFKSNEYASLLGGEQYEPKEENPMLGWRGASRYYDEHFREAFALECRAVRRVREEMGLTNLKVMVPFCRTVEEGRKVIAEMQKYGLRRAKPAGRKAVSRERSAVSNLEVYVMCEIPSNIILAEQFATIFDGFSIGSNDLTQLTLGVDRDSALVSHVYDERNEAVKRLIAHVITIAKKHRRKIGICGQGPSDFPDFAEFLVEQGIDSISLNPDTVLKTTLRILQKEKRMKRRKKGR